MGLLDKVMFWKKKDDLADLGLGLEGDLPHPGGKEPDLGLGMDSTGLGDVGTGKGIGEPATPTDKMPGFGAEEHTFGAEQPLSSSPSAPQTPEIPQPAAQMAPPAAPTPPPKISSDHNYIVSKELEIISTKLDALRVAIDSVSHRLAALEKIARGDHERSW